MNNILNNRKENKKKARREKRLEKFFELHGTFYSANFFIGGLPSQDQNKKSIFVWEINYKYKVRIKADIEYGLPYGVFARLIQIWIDTRLVLGEYLLKRDGYILDIGASINDFILNKLKLADNSGQYYKAVNEQILRYSTCNFEFIKEEKEKNNVISFAFFPYRRFIIDKRKIDFKILKVSRDYGDLIVKEKKAFPVPENLLYLMSGSCLGIDFLRFVIWRTYTATKQNRTIIIPMKALIEQLAPGVGNTRERTQQIKKHLNTIKAVWKGLNANITTGKRNKPAYLIIKPSNFLTIPKN